MTPPIPPSIAPTPTAQAAPAQPPMQIASPIPAPTLESLAAQAKSTAEGLVSAKEALQAADAALHDSDAANAKAIADFKASRMNASQAAHAARTAAYAAYQAALDADSKAESALITFIRTGA